MKFELKIELQMKTTIKPRIINDEGHVLTFRLSLTDAIRG